MKKITAVMPAQGRRSLRDTTWVLPHSATGVYRVRYFCGEGNLPAGDGYYQVMLHG